MSWSGLMDWHVFLAVFFGAAIGIAGERFRHRWERLERRAKFGPPSRDASAQLRLVTGSGFRARKLMSKPEARVFYVAERALRSTGSRCRVMAQVNLGEILSCTDKRAFSAVNSKRVDMLIISSSGDPLLAIEYQGEGHYQSDAPARDAVKKEALRQAGIGYLEVSSGDGDEEIMRQITRLLPGKT